MHSTLCRALLISTAALAAASAQAAVIFSEDFNNPGFGTGVGPNSSDRFGPTSYTNINNFNGWTFAGQALVATKIGTNDRAVLLNENPLGSMTHALTGLVVGQSYTVQFLLSGDNQPNQGYGLQSLIDNAVLLTSFGVDGLSGSVAGVVQSFSFLATSTSASLQFKAIHPLSGSSPASPMIDNIVVSSAATIPEPTGLALAGLALLGLGATRRRRH